MKLKLSILLAILSLSLLCYADKDRGVACNSVETLYQLDSHDDETYMSSADDLNNLIGLRGSSNNFAKSHNSNTKSNCTRRNLYQVIAISFATATLNSEFSFARSCNFPFGHRPQRELFFVLRNIRI